MMRETVERIYHLLLLCIVVMFLKTGIRTGELDNIDIRDVHLSRIHHWCRPVLRHLKVVEQGVVVFILNRPSNPRPTSAGPRSLFSTKVIHLTILILSQTHKQIVDLTEDKQPTSEPLAHRI
jgi:integrase